MVILVRRVLGALVVLGLFLVTIAFGSSPATAAPYPPTGTAAVTVSSTTPCTGQSIKVGGTNFGANEVVTLDIAGTAVGSATTDADGSFDPSVTTPDLVGGQSLTGTGQTSGLTASLTLTIRDCAAAGGASGGGGGGGLASTGVKIAGLSLFAAALIGLGLFFATAGRRRKSAARA
jgi:hypothetical protein